MSNSRGGVRDADLDGALADLGQHFPYPPTPDVSAAVQSRLEHLDRPSRLLPRGHARLRPASVGALALVLLVVASILAASPAARAAVAQWLGIPGVRISTGGTILPPGRLGRTAQLGRRVTLADAQAHVSFHALLPILADLGRPDEVYLDSVPPGGRISLLYRAQPGLPATRDTGVGLVLTEFQATKGQVFFGKSVGWRSIPEGIRVGTGHGYWITGDHLTFIYRTVSGRQVWSNVRPAGNTLLWEHDGLTLRLESALTERAALRIAASLR